jgi:hypothetical protein
MLIQVLIFSQGEYHTVTCDIGLFLKTIFQDGTTYVDTSTNFF